MKVLLLTNSHPTRHSPSGAAYITARLAAFDALRAAGESVDVTAVALRPRYVRGAGLLRRVTGALDNAALTLPDDDAGRRYLDAACEWSPLDVVAGRRHRRPDGAVRSAVKAVLALPDVAAGGFDVVHAHGLYTLPAGEVARRVAARLGVPYVVSLHGSDVEVVARHDPATAAATLRAAAATIYVSDALRASAARLGLPTHHAHVVPNGVDLATFAARPATVSDAPPGVHRAAGDDDPGRPRRFAAAGGTPSTRHATGEDPADAAPPTITASAGRDRPRLLFVGNLLPVKGADRLPAVVDGLRALGRDPHLTVAGDGALRADLERRIPDATFAGRVPQARVADLMRDADVLLVPSRSEGWGCVITESYAAGTPVVAFGVGGIPEAALPGPGLVTPAPGDADATQEAAAVDRFVAAVNTVTAAPPPAADMAAHVAHADWLDVARRELAVLRAVVGGGPGPAGTRAPEPAGPLEPSGPAGPSGLAERAESSGPAERSEPCGPSDPAPPTGPTAPGAPAAPSAGAE